MPLSGSVAVPNDVFVPSNQFRLSVPPFPSNEMDSIVYR